MSDLLQEGCLSDIEPPQGLSPVPVRGLPGPSPTIPRPGASSGVYEAIHTCQDIPETPHYDGQECGS